MASKNKNKNGEAPKTGPPGQVLAGGHGMQGQTLAGKQGSARLRELLSLSADVPLETVCDEAAAELEALRAKGVTK